MEGDGGCLKPAWAAEAETPWPGTGPDLAEFPRMPACFLDRLPCKMEILYMSDFRTLLCPIFRPFALFHQISAISRKGVTPAGMPKEGYAASAGLRRKDTCEIRSGMAQAWRQDALDPEQGLDENGIFKLFLNSF